MSFSSTDVSDKFGKEFAAIIPLGGYTLGIFGAAIWGDSLIILIVLERFKDLECSFHYV